MTNIEKLKQFIQENNLEFNSGSGGDVNILALCGYACYIEAKFDEVCSSIPKENCTGDLGVELERVFDYASTHNYAKFWETQTAKDQYKF